MPLSGVLLGVCYNKGKLLARMDVLAGTNLVAIPASSRKAALDAMRTTPIDVMVLCADMADSERKLLSAEFRKARRGAVIWVLKHPCKRLPRVVDGFAIEDEPEQIRAAIATALAAVHK